jgi:hypothetical protein
MDNVAPRFRIELANVIDAATVQRVHLKAVGSNGKQKGRFVHDKKGVVLKQDIQINGVFRCGRWRTFFSGLSRKEFDLILGHKFVFCTMYNFAIDQDSPLSQHLSQASVA